MPKPYLALGASTVVSFQLASPKFPKDRPRPFGHSPWFSCRTTGADVSIEKLPVVFSVSRGPDWRWADITGGWWEPESDHLEVHGEVVPQQVIDDLASVDPADAKGGQVEIPYGRCRYRMTFGRDPRIGH